MPTYRLDLAYDGTGFRGLARQPGLRTVQGAVEEALGRTLQTEVSTVAAGRTDAGVHARQQVMSFKLADPADCDRLLRSLASQLHPEVVPGSLEAVDDDFDARHTATSRTYRYQIDNRPHPTPWARQAVWYVPEPLKVEAMDQAAQALVGEHDYAAFCRANSAGGTIRRVESASWHRGDLVTFTIRASSFCHQMVRSIVGLSVDIGRGRRSSAEMAEVLSSRKRGRAGQLAPARGLILWEVSYEA